jgi:hypothetical protein
MGLGALSKVRDSLQIASGDDDLPDDAIVCKVGLSEDMDVRIRRLKGGLGKLAGVEMALLLFAYVDPANQSAAEAEVLNWFAGIRARLKLNITVKSYTEVVAFEKEQLHCVRELYKRISLQYGAEAGTALEREKQVLQTRLAAKEEVMAAKDAVHAEVIAAKDAVIEVQSKYVSLLEATRAR